MQLLGGNKVFFMPDKCFLMLNDLCLIRNKSALYLSRLQPGLLTTDKVLSLNPSKQTIKRPHFHGDPLPFFLSMQAAGF